MAVKAGPTQPVKKLLDSSDPSGDTWVMIKPATYRDDILRGELLKDSRLVASGVQGVGMQSFVNQYALRAEEIWLTFEGAHLVLEGEDEKGKISAEEPFKDKTRANWSRGEFMDALDLLPPFVVIEWSRKVIEVNADWALPF